MYRVGGAPIGPLTTAAVAEAILAGQLPPDCWVAAPGGSRWLRAVDVPVIARVIEGLPTRRRASGMRMATAPMPTSPSPMARKLDETVDDGRAGSVDGGDDDETVVDGRRVPSELGNDGEPLAGARRRSDGETACERGRPLSVPEPSPPPTVRSVDPRGPDGFPLPPPSSSPPPPRGYRDAETLESPFEDSPRRRTLGG